MRHSSEIITHEEILNRRREIHHIRDPIYIAENKRIKDAFDLIENKRVKQEN